MGDEARQLTQRVNEVWCYQVAGFRGTKKIYGISDNGLGFAMHLNTAADG